MEKSGHLARARGGNLRVTFALSVDCACRRLFAFAATTLPKSLSDVGNHEASKDWHHNRTALLFSWCVGLEPSFGAPRCRPASALRLFG